MGCNVLVTLRSKLVYYVFMCFDFDPEENKILIEKYINKLLKGDYVSVEREIYKRCEEAAAEYIKEILFEVMNSEKMGGIKKILSTKYDYPNVRKTEVTITLGKGNRIKVPSWYGQKGANRRGRPKKGPNGTGVHLMLKYWGFQSKYSPTYIEHIAREGSSSQSYELATENLKSQGYGICSKTVDLITHKVGDISIENRSLISVNTSETLAGKRVLLAIDGGRVRTRKTKKGRYKKNQKRARYNTDWKETKVFVFCELNDKGKKLKGSKSLYDATMGKADEAFSLFINQAKAVQLSDAKEIIMTGDGASWIWERYKKMATELNIVSKTTEVLDWYHACQHLNVLSEAIKKTEFEKKSLYNEIKDILYKGDIELLEKAVSKHMSSVKRISKENRKIIKRELCYFRSNKSRIQYQEYEKLNKPRGSGVVESAVRRIVNQKIKSPGIFWKIQNVEKMLHLRCVLLSGRWKTLVRNIVKFSRFTLEPMMLCN